MAACVATDADVGAVDELTTGPLSSEQPLAQPEAAGPTNIGEYVPRLDVLTGLA